MPHELVDEATADVRLEAALDAVAAQAVPELRGLLGMPEQQVTHEQRDVLASLPQRRQADAREEARQKVGAKGALVAVGRPDEAYVDPPGDRLAHGLVLALVHHAQELA